MKKTASTLEKDIEVAVKKVIEGAGGQCLKYFNPNDTGWPDRIILMPDIMRYPHPITGEASTWWVEFKRPGETVKRADQKARREWLLERGHKYRCITTWQEAFWFITMDLRLECPNFMDNRKL